jgi:hypothetical protein
MTAIRGDRGGRFIPGEGVDRLGDAVEMFLDSYGITKEWWSDFLEKHGLPPCDCAANQQWLNDTSNAHPAITHFGVKLLNALKRKAA